MTSRFRWLAFAGWTLLILLLAPFANRIQKWTGVLLGESVVRYVLSAILLVAIAGVAAFLARRRAVAARQILWLAAIAALTLAVTWRLEVAAEPAHLAQYSVLAFLAFSALRSHLDDAGVYPAAAVLTTIVGTVDEIFQWLLPNRFWDFGDVGLDAAAGVLVQLVIWQGVRPLDVAHDFGPRSIRLAARLAACEALLLLLCVSNTPPRIDAYARWIPGLGYLGKGLATRMSDYGHRYVDPEIGRFQSRLSHAELRRLDRERGEEAAKILDRLRGREAYHRLQARYPGHRAPLVFEAGGHLFYRDRLLQRAREQEGDDARIRLATAAYRENLILERYFTHTLDSSKAALAPRDRRFLERLQRPEAAFESEVGNWLVTAFSETQARIALLAALVVLAALYRYAARRPEWG